MGSVHLDNADPDVALNFSYAWSPSTYLSSTSTLSTNISLPSQPAPDPSLPAPAPIMYYYTLSATNTNYGCTASSQQTVAHYRPRKIYVPSAFRPQPYGSGIVTPTSLFRPINIQDYPGAEFSVYYYWGQRIFYAINGTTLQDYSWDGTIYSSGFHIDQPNGTYVWQVRNIGCALNIYSASDGDGIPHGTVVIIRP